jgi:small subunit ribosomal protein S3Ae
MAETKTVVKVKKRWFTVLAPELFNKRELADISAVSADSTVGKFIDVTGQMLTGVPKDMNRKYKLKIFEAVGDKVNTKPQAYYITESFVQRTARRYKERFIYVTKGTSKDGKIIVIKLQFFNLKKLHHSERGALLAQTKSFLANETKNIDAEQLFDPLTIEKLAADLRKALADIYAVDKIILTKLSVAN